MGIYRLEDSSLKRVLESTYDLAIFACGYEARGRDFAKYLDKKFVKNVLVLSFADFRQSGDRKRNEEYFASEWTSKLIEIDSREDRLIYDAIDSSVDLKRPVIRILVDYSSMPRLWYAGVLNWARFGDHGTEIAIDFIYSVGEHRHEVKPMVIDDILCVPGCEGGPVPLSKAVAVFGLGFDGLPPLCVLDRMEPDVVYAFLAAPAAFADYPEKARQANKTLIEDHARVTLELPLYSVEATFRMLGELIEPHRKEADITVIPVGPKPHVLAGMLLALRYEEVACLRVTGRRPSLENVDASGSMVCTRVEFKPNQWLGGY